MIWFSSQLHTQWTFLYFLHFELTLFFMFWNLVVILQSLYFFSATLYHFEGGSILFQKRRLSFFLTVAVKSSTSCNNQIETADPPHSQLSDKWQFLDRTCLLHSTRTINRSWPLIWILVFFWKAFHFLLCSLLQQLSKVAFFNGSYPSFGKYSCKTFTSPFKTVRRI